MTAAAPLIGTDDIHTQCTTATEQRDYRGSDQIVQTDSAIVCSACVFHKETVLPSVHVRAEKGSMGTEPGHAVTGAMGALMTRVCSEG